MCCKNVERAVISKNKPRSKISVVKEKFSGCKKEILVRISKLYLLKTAIKKALVNVLVSLLYITTVGLTEDVSQRYSKRLLSKMTSD